MSRDPFPEPDEPGRPGPDPRGGLQTTDPLLLVGLGLFGLVVGWGVRLAAVQLGFATPRVGWLQVGTLSFVALILASVAHLTRRELPSRPHLAVNRLVLAKACALAGALMAGGYLGSALSWVGIDAETASSRILRSVLAGLAAVLVMAAALLLERACRVRGGPGES